MDKTSEQVGRIRRKIIATIIHSGAVIHGVIALNVKILNYNYHSMDLWMMIVIVTPKIQNHSELNQ